MLTRRTCENGTWPGPLVPSAGKGEQAPLEQSACEVLLRDVDVSSSPTIADLTQVGHERLPYRPLEAEQAEDTVERVLGPFLIEALERLA